MERVLSSGGVLITGATGQIGGALVEMVRQRFPDLPVFSPARSDMDLGEAASVQAYIQKVQPRWIVSSGAYTAVDAAESDREAAWAANATAPGVMAQEAARSGAVMIHLSTDYVFPGTGDRPWVETDATGPLNVYGASKLAGEQAIAASGAAHITLRTSWVYSDTGKNFVRTMLRLLTTRDTALRVVSDQHGAPTSAEDLAETVCAILGHIQHTADSSGTPAAEVAHSVTGVYHCAGTGETTWAGLALAIRSYLAERGDVILPDIIPVPSSEYPVPAARPRNSRLNCGRLETVFGIVLPEWQSSLEKVLRRLTATATP